jgi:hypothetical protein
LACFGKPCFRQLRLSVGDYEQGVTEPARALSRCQFATWDNVVVEAVISGGFVAETSIQCCFGLRLASRVSNLTQ